MQATYLRILFVVINFTLAAALPIMEAWGVSSASASGSHPPAVDLDDYVYRRLSEPPPVDWTEIVAGLLPERPQPSGPPPPSTPVARQDPSPSGGPLAEDWQYVQYMRTGDGRVNLVKLKRIGKGPTPARRSGRSLSSRSRRPSGRRTSRRAPETTDSIILFVKDRVVQDPAFGIAFLIDSANNETFDYVLPADPTRVYSLPFVARSGPFEPSTETDPPKKKRHFVPAGWNKRVETEYQRLRSGELKFSEATTLNP